MFVPRLALSPRLLGGFLAGNIADDSETAWLAVPGYRPTRHCSHKFSAVRTNSPLFAEFYIFSPLEQSWQTFSGDFAVIRVNEIEYRPTKIVFIVAYREKRPAAAFINTIFPAI
jgi:hypothetical protein